MNKLPLLALAFVASTQAGDWPAPDDLLHIQGMYYLDTSSIETLPRKQGMMVGFQMISIDTDAHITTKAQYSIACKSGNGVIVGAQLLDQTGRVTHIPKYALPKFDMRVGSALHIMAEKACGYGYSMEKRPPAPKAKNLGESDEYASDWQ